jgi:hypothetical protein
LSREANRLQVRRLDGRGRLFASIAAFLKSVDVVENELLDPAAMPEPFGSVLRAGGGSAPKASACWPVSSRSGAGRECVFSLSSAPAGGSACATANRPPVTLACP